jgi:hypothetical protein
MGYFTRKSGFAVFPQITAFIAFNILAKAQNLYLTQFGAVLKVPF